MLSKLYDKKVAYEKDLRFIVESVLGDEELDPDEDGVDVESIPMSIVQQANAALDAIVSKDDYDDTDIEDMLDDDDDDEIDLIVESAITDMDFYVNEAVDAKLQKYKLYFSNVSKEANNNLRDAKKYLKAGEYDNALKSVATAKKGFQECLKTADNIDDDELVIVMLDVAVRVCIGYVAPMFLLTKLGVGYTVSYVVSFLTGYIMGVSKMMNWTANVSDDDISKHKGVGGNPNPWKPSVSRTEAKTRMTKMITVCDKLSDQIKEAKKNRK